MNKTITCRLVVLLASCFMAQFDFFVVNAAAPSFERSLRAGPVCTGRTVLASAPGAQVCWHRIEPMAPVCDLLPPLARPDRTAALLQKGQAHVTSPADLPRGER
jgi:hypothetical protein